MGFPGGSDGKESAYDAGALGWIPELGRSLRGGHGDPLRYSCLQNPHGQRSLEGYSPWSLKELEMTEATEHARTYRQTITREDPLSIGLPRQEK